MIEGIMMRGPKKLSIVVRTKDGLIEKTDELKQLKDKYPILGFVFIRGVINLATSMSIGVKSVMYSADNMPEDEQEEASKFDIWVEEKLGSEKAEKVFIAIAMVLAVVISVGLFMLLPTFLAGFASHYIDNAILRSLCEGALRILIFLTYLWLTTKMKQIKRVWAYHGAEHKAIYCYEKGLPLTIENIKEQSSLHPRCGTSFLFIVMIVSILVFSLTTWNNLLMRFALRIALLPIVVAISYEIIKLAGRYDNFLTRIISAPGKALQRLTTSEPDDEMIEVAQRAIELVIPESEQEAKW
ncbi:MAG: DUF1385 domain-containing protein [Oscillospiraceae bacterium]|nr:DUF1385 domain-containing protein [Oscillospiraceae bacterium]